MCGMLPTPDEARVRDFPDLLVLATKSLASTSGLFGETTSTSGVWTTSETATKSFCGL